MPLIAKCSRAGPPAQPYVTTEAGVIDHKR